MLLAVLAVQSLLPRLPRLPHSRRLLTAILVVVFFYVWTNVPFGKHRRVPSSTSRDFVFPARIVQIGSRVRDIAFVLPLFETTLPRDRV